MQGKRPSIGSDADVPQALTVLQVSLKRAFDVLISLVLLTLTWPVIVIAAAVARRSTGASGVFRQQRIGRGGQPFEVMKIRTMRPVCGTTVTTTTDARITRAGALMRRFKIDELPQLFNVLRGEMSLVGPRPDVVGFADQLRGADRILLSVCPGITGPAALAYRDEETILATVADPEAYNRDVIWVDKVRINRAYLENWSFASDLACLVSALRLVLVRGDQQT